MMYAEMVAQAGINFEAFGVEIEIGVPATGAIHARSISAELYVGSIFDTGPAVVHHSHWCAQAGIIA